MDRKFAWNRISQLPVAMFGVVHAFFLNGISLFKLHNPISNTNCEMPLLPYLTD